MPMMNAIKIDFEKLCAQALIFENEFGEKGCQFLSFMSTLLKTTNTEHFNINQDSKQRSQIDF